MSDTQCRGLLPGSNKNPESLQAGTGEPITQTHVLKPGEALYSHAPLLLLTNDGDRAYILRAESEAADMADLLAWEATRGGFTPPSDVDAHLYRLPKGDTPQ